ncbi:helix-turn-helix domain-containing protein [Streptomyces flaveolus]
MDVQQLSEYRYRAVREVLGGSPIGEVAARYGTSRQTLHSWRRRFEQEGMPGLLDRSRRPWNMPTRLSAEVGAEICELRRRHPRWGARRISHTARPRESPASTTDRSPPPISPSTRTSSSDAGRLSFITTPTPSGDDVAAGKRAWKSAVGRGTSSSGVGGHGEASGGGRWCVKGPVLPVRCRARGRAAGGVVWLI